MAAPTSTASTESIPVTADNFVPAETDRTLGSFVTQGALGKFNHSRELAPVADQHVQRTNLDTLYWISVVTWESPLKGLWPVAIS
jgi:hypothetical protein